MYVVYWRRSLHRIPRDASWPTLSNRTTKVVGVIKGEMNEVVSYMDSIIEDNIKQKLNGWHICYANANVNPNKLTFTILRHSNNDKDSMMLHYVAIKVDYLN